MEKRYKALRTISTIYKVLGIIAGVITLLSILAICATSILGGSIFDLMLKGQGGGSFPVSMFSGVLFSIMFSLGAIIYGGAISVTLYALGEGIDLLIALEENTRTTSTLLRENIKS